MFFLQKKHQYTQYLPYSQQILRILFQRIEIAGENGTIACPTVAQESVYVATNDGQLLALSVADGTLRWRYKTEGLQLSQPLVANDVIYVGGSDGCIYALQATNGSLLWQTCVGNSISVIAQEFVQKTAV